MPRYFFDIDDGERRMRDNEGSEYSGLQDARDAAIRTLPEIARDVVPDGDHKALVVIARDACDQPLFRVTLSLRTEWLPARTGQATRLRGDSFAA